MKLNLYFFILAFLCAFSGYCGDESAISFRVTGFGKLPSVGPERNTGVAGAFSGIVDNKLIVAGGANFPDKKPWEGGRKVFHDRIYVWQLSDSTGIQLITGSQQLPFEIAYGASVSVPGGILCIGGNDHETCYAKTFLLKWDDPKKEVQYEPFPDLPEPLTYASAVLSGNTVYVVGGSSSPDGTDTGNYFYRLDLARQGTPGFGWEVAPPYPGPGRIHAVSAVQSNGTRTCIYLFSGRNVSQKNELTVFTDGLIYDPVLKKWDPINPIVSFPVMAGTALQYGSNSILFFGGAPGNLLSQEQQLKEELSKAIRSRDTLAISTSKDALLKYNNSHP
ncbi:MAG: hypothetical protein ABFD10_06570 [Prolixibacteraceae bacterium]